MKLSEIKSTVSQIKNMMEMLSQLAKIVKIENGVITIYSPVNIVVNDNVVIKASKNISISSNHTEIDPSTNKPFSIFLNSDENDGTITIQEEEKEETKWLI